MSVPTTKIVEFRQVLEGLRQVDGQLPESLKAAAVEASLRKAETKISETAQAEQVYRAKADESQAALREVNDLMTRLRAAVKGVYGPDSAEYQKVGGTRTSDRKRPSRRPATSEPV